MSLGPHTLHLGLSNTALVSKSVAKATESCLGCLGLHYAELKASYEIRDATRYAPPWYSTTLGRAEPLKM